MTHGKSPEKAKVMHDLLRPAVDGSTEADADLKEQIPRQNLPPVLKKGHR
jgi:hypothetical protein